MSKKLINIVLIAVVLVLSLISTARSKNVGELEDISLYVVYSSTDDDAQVFIAGGSEEPLKKVSVFGPQKDFKFINVKFRDGYNLGQADFQFGF